jgi:hypothetical protein
MFWEIIAKYISKLEKYLGRPASTSRIRSVAVTAWMYRVGRSAEGRSTPSNQRARAVIGQVGFGIEIAGVEALLMGQQCF